ncbi:hypothetical protein [Actinoplanes sp. CA-252034]|uniref:hypothetical protein n=1 Tax=Actinoplanes sp. CA-252034 TaxID=3239906 RepID=UPI003D9915B3
MSARAARLLAVPFVLVACALRLVSSLWVEPFTWNVEPFALGLLAILSLLGGSLGLPLSGYLLLTGQARKRPAAWQADAGARRFVAGPSPSWAGSSAVVLGWMAGGLLPTERVPGEDRKRIAELGLFTQAAVVLAVAALLFAIWLVLGRWPWLALDRDGVTISKIVGERRIPWADLPPEKVRERGLHIDPAFLSFTFRAYREDPSARAAIGTRAEAERLESAYRSAR